MKSNIVGVYHKSFNSAQNELILKLNSLINHGWTPQGGVSHTILKSDNGDPETHYLSVLLVSHD